MLNLAEQYLVESIKKGDQKSFEFLFKSNYSNLCKYARNIVHNEITAEDLVMDIFVRIWESPEKLVISTSISGYLYQCVHNHCINYLTRKHKQFSELNAETIEQLNVLMPADTSGDPLIGINIVELTNRIDKSIELLPEECRKIFILSRKEELSHKEIAAQLGISENTVKVQIYRALIKMHILLREFLPG
jgi:RNA polymerase sigma factor, sigma-70 family/RNA polymerase sigma-70 factor, Bacteroides expansion family 1